MIDLFIVYGILQLVTISTGFFMYKNSSKRHEVSEIYIKRLMNDIVELNKSVKRIRDMTIENNESIWIMENASVTEPVVEPVVAPDVEPVVAPVVEPVAKPIVKKTGTFSNITNRIHRKLKC
jgi:hypothetical protein